MDSNRSIGNSQTESHLVWGVACCSLAAAVLLGAFGAHALKDAVGAERLETYRTANQYHFYSCFFLLAIAAMRERKSDSTSVTRRLLRAQQLWGWGTLLFCSSIYLAAVRGLIGLDSASWLGAVAPIGGLLLIAGALLAATALWHKA